MTNQGVGNGRKIALGASILGVAALAIFGLGFAYFSDIISGSGNATAGSLDITGSITFKQNNTGADLTSISNLNPGDTINIASTNITNGGSKSAWVRSVLNFSSITGLTNWLWVCDGGTAQADLITASFFTGGNIFETTDDGFANSALVTGGTCKKADTTSDFGNATPVILDGSAEDDDGTSGIVTTLTASTMPIIYFDAAATNAAQAGTAAFSVKVQALQYRNNATTPNETAWETVVDTPFSL